ncbi:pimeloyl-ACP methyl ester carboxylesterase [Larkinella arboricola]|uniref:Pimeloyl-ACP methyl ester carboxylesterase n=1 Tax=Larkinella arboricola TaxID=643671 RepID=A0A327WMN6_LARAB|nr:alpha/beta hydrolase [Larkinella arboricola]RAJ92088.1 pimeloyl-ACP methyl ester carboxylesterase [Larkinella arboricola]
MSYIQAGTAANGEPVNLFYQDWGTGNPVVLIHGWPLSHEMWEYQMTELPRHGLRCIAYDRRGFGKSSKPWDGYDYDTLAADLKAVLDELDLRNVTLVGFSMGGGEVVRYVSRYGADRVSKIVLVSAVTPYLLKADDNQDGVDQSVFDEMLEKIQADRADFLATFGKQFYGVSLLSHPVSDSFLQWNQTLALLGSPRATIECVRAFSGTDFRSDMAAINIPTLIIHGDSDATVPFEASGQKTHAMIPQSQLLVYEGEPHGLFFTRKDQLNSDLLAFISSTTTVTETAY